MKADFQKMPHSGIAGRIITEAFRLHGIRTEFEFYPWKRAFMLAQEGEYDGTALWFKNSARESAFYFTEPVITEKFVFFHLKSQPLKWQTPDDLRGKVLGGLLGFSYGNM